MTDRLAFLFATVLAMLIGLTLLGGCANQQYAGINYGEVVTPDGEHWIVAGGKDETNVTFEVRRPDGTTATYHADNADASTVIKAMAASNAEVIGKMTDLIKLMATKGVTP